MDNSRINNLIGKRYGKLTVTRFLYSERVAHPIKGNSHTNTYWECICDCGNKVKTLTRYLNSGSVKSCGCLYYENRPKPKKETAFNETYNSYIARAKQKDIIFNISKEKFRELTSEKCFYCNAEPQQVSKKNSEYPFIYNGLDRLDNSVGYTVENVVPCCGLCNRIKNIMSLDEFKRHLLKIIENRNW